ncbi:MAG: hypothetical protein JNJ59_23885 [Deltaproteobacteria bacterium]|nr:hypothetical protein [Deltaproteobacteria bacterium]
MEAVDVAEPVPDVVEPAPDGEGAAHAGIPVRTVRASTVVEPGGCAAGGLDLGATALGLLALAACRLWVRRARGTGALIP